MESVFKRKCSGLLSEKLKALTSGLTNAKAKRRVTFTVNVVLQQAITDGDKEEIKKLITKHGNSVLDQKDPTGMPLLHRAIFEDQFECFELMVIEGADLLATDEKGWNALHVAVSFEDMDAIELLLQHKPELINTRTMDSLRPINVCGSNCKLCAYLLQVEVTYLKTRSVTHWDSANRKREELELLNMVMRVNEEDERSTRQVWQSALLLSAVKNYLGLAYYILENQLVTVDCEDYEHWTALHLAALHSSMDVLVLLIQYGANVEKLTSCYKSPVDLADDKLTVEILSRGSEQAV
ncbi:protein phosphatase 1 regulatory inhibitor subunit 16B-like [Dysidea avara]|uniref:protein phosphatase 1 regulatory inhibitor subunit 16B-like n=1 Tax=Dysidea avara TaxID=196820 RepID=UPI0033341CCB